MSFWKTKPKTEAAVVPAQRRPSEGETAHARALASLEGQRAKGPEVRRVSDSLKALRARNHFAAQIEHLFTGGTA